MRISFQQDSTQPHAPRQVNSIHGDWYDPSNPVVQFSGSLRDDLFGALLAAERAADLVLVLGTSLSGMNADRVAESAARRCDLRAAQCPPSAAEVGFEFDLDVVRF